MRVLLAAGGTGGHIYPAVAVARALGDRGAEVALVGQADGMEARIAADHDLPFHGVRAGKWDRQAPDPLQATAALAGLFDAVRIVARLRPDALVGFGGFASFPGCVAATLLRVPLILHEGNAFPGRVTRWFQRRARVVLAAQPEVARRLPGARRVEVVGFPVREDRIARAAARKALGLPAEGVLTLVMGGSQGSQALNELVPRAFAALGEGERPGVLHSTGPRWIEAMREGTAWPGYHCRAYLDATLAWSAADLAITRAGISTLAEAAFHGVPVIAVPLPTAAEDHQRHNAAAVAAAGAGRHVEQTDPDGLVSAWRGLLDPAERARAAEASRGRSHAGAAAAVADRIESELRASSQTTHREERA